MKKIGFIITFLCMALSLFAQQNDLHRYELNNQTLKEYIGVYISQTAQWAKENHFASYAICMLSDSYKDYHTIDLTIITDRVNIDALQLTSYTEVGGTPVFIQNKMSGFFDTDYSFADNVLKQYHIKLPDSKAETKRENQAYITEHILKADSLIFKTPQGDKKLALKDYPPIKIASANDGEQLWPYSMELTFFKNMCQGMRRYK